MAVEKQRLEVSNRRTDVVRMMVEANDASDKRQYDYRMATLESQDKQASKSHFLLRTVVFSGGGVATIIIAFLLYMSFLGSAEQSKIALRILGVFGTAAGGAGVYRLLASGIQKLTDKPSD